jgi:hypothetical protein
LTGIFYGGISDCAALFTCEAVLRGSTPATSTKFIPAKTGIFFGVIVGDSALAKQCFAPAPPQICKNGASVPFTPMELVPFFLFNHFFKISEITA